MISAIASARERHQPEHPDTSRGAKPTQPRPTGQGATQQRTTHSSYRNTERKSASRARPATVPSDSSRPLHLGGARRLHLGLGICAPFENTGKPHHGDDFRHENNRENHPDDGSSHPGRLLGRLHAPDRRFDGILGKFVAHRAVMKVAQPRKSQWAAHKCLRMCTRPDVRGAKPIGQAGCGLAGAAFIKGCPHIRIHFPRAFVTRSAGFFLKNSRPSHWATHSPRRAE